ncbi:class I SAM-dependent methyltransferase [Piscinibacter sakaiensis]|uniref:class I SAM-dependent methyltransferase n=1 Tax=Piscinibacter sakaiensis TaxID=1547922 RepID=UPI003AAE91D5
MTNRYRKQWEALAADDPFWAVLTDPRMKGGKWDSAAFFQTGTDEIGQLVRDVSELGIEVTPGIALDYGCGVGRLSRALSKAFAQVIAVDISETMLARARIEHASFTNIRFIRGNGNDLHSVGDASIDFVYSNIVLQHAPQATQRALIAEFCRVLRPGGALVFQTPSHPHLNSLNGIVHRLAGNRVLNLARRLKYGRAGVMEMHTFRRGRVVELLRRTGMQLISVQRDDAAGGVFASYRYFAVKP